LNLTLANPLEKLVSAYTNMSALGIGAGKYLKVLPGCAIVGHSPSFHIR